MLGLGGYNSGIASSGVSGKFSIKGCFTKEDNLQILYAIPFLL